MPIRKRGESYQIDVRLADGQRIRRNYPTQQAAEQAAAIITPNPAQRAAMRKLRASRKSSARSNSTAVHAQQSSRPEAI